MGKNAKPWTFDFFSFFLLKSKKKKKKAEPGTEFPFHRQKGKKKNVSLKMSSSWNSVKSAKKTRRTARNAVFPYSKAEGQISFGILYYASAARSP